MSTTKQIRLLAVRAWETAGGILFVTKMRMALEVVVLSGLATFRTPCWGATSEQAP